MTATKGCRQITIYDGMHRKTNVALEETWMDVMKKNSSFSDSLISEDAKVSL